MFKKVLIANRGEIACRVLRTLQRLGVRSVAVHSEADAHALHVRMADEAVCLGPAPVGESYLRGERILEAARATGAEALHPGYGFLSENAAFAESCHAAGVTFIGPTPDQIRRFGLKHLAREIAVAQGVPLLPGTGLLNGADEALREAAHIGYPVMLKSTAGGGGIGLRVCRDPAGLVDAWDGVQRLATKNFANGGAYLEKYLEVARHVEVQIFGDGRGHVLALGERDCSAQRRNQKVIEETPAPGLLPETRAGLLDAAARLGRAISYQSAGTVEFVVDARTQSFFFLEVNTRLQVEHGVTEAVTGVDLVEWMVKLAAGDLHLPAHAPAATGAAIEVRLYAEDPAKAFRPSTGRLTAVRLPDGAGVRCDHWVEPGLEVTPHYDPLLAKIITSGAHRDEALSRLHAALAATALPGIETNLGYVREAIASAPFSSGSVHTRLLDTLPFAPATIDVLDGGTQTTVQDFPGRLGHWAVGVPPSGPMDDFGFRVANRLVGNPEGASALEMTLTGATVRFNKDAVIALAGAPFAAKLDGVPVRWEAPLSVSAGATLRVGAVSGTGARAYLAVRGGLDVPAYLGSRSTFMLGGFGGHGGRALRVGDVLHFGGTAPASDPVTPAARIIPAPDSEGRSARWELAVLYGPHGAPDFFTDDDIATFFETWFEVHYNSDRTGVRLIGPKPRWARPDGGEAGLHPSNIHDNAYAVGTVDFTGDMPILLGPDGPSLGGFVCPATVIQAERWKLGQLKAGDRVRFVRVDANHAAARKSELDAHIASLFQSAPARRVQPPANDTPILDELPDVDGRVRVVYRRAGDDHVLVEYGPLRLDLALRLRAHALMRALEVRALPGVIDLTPGIRSLQVHHDPHTLPTSRLLSVLRQVEEELPSVEDLVIPSRIVHLPLSWEDEATLQAIEKYMRVVRADAPWCPSNIEFIRRINGLSSVDDVRRIVFDASYLVFGLGDVYLGAPVATPLDPRHRLVTTKYNPARTWTPENAVGIGGAYLCIYGMEGPGGYQFVGRTLQVWNTHRPFEDGKPHLLRFFDQIRFYPVDGRELLRLRADFPYGRVPLRIEDTELNFRDHNRFLNAHTDSIAAFQNQQRAAFEAERQRWAAAGHDLVATEPAPAVDRTAASVPDGCFAVESPVAGSLWRVLRGEGERVGEDEPLAIVEAMKTEISVLATATGVIRKVCVAPGAPVQPGQTLFICEEAA